MPRPLTLDWCAPALKVSRSWRVALLIAIAAALASLVWLSRSSASLESIQRARADNARASSVGGPRSDSRGSDALREEIAAINRQVTRLNEQWDRLLANVQPSRPAVRILELDVNAQGRQIRVVGQAARVSEMMDYAAELAQRSTLLDVALVRHEADESGRGYRFQVEAKWADGR